MRIGILQCDTVHPDLIGTFGDYPDMFGELLACSTDPDRFSVFDLAHNDFPAGPDDCDAWLITGSQSSVLDEAQWIARAHALVRTLHARRAPMVGICFGHQLIARALGGEVHHHPGGWGVGRHVCHVTAHKPWMEPPRNSYALLVSHQDQVCRLPPGATRLAGHDFCPFDMFQAGQHVLAMQGHPEFEPGYSRALIERRRDRIGTARAEEALASLQQPVDSDLMARWIRKFLRQAVHDSAGSAATMRRHARSENNSQ